MLLLSISAKTLIEASVKKYVGGRCENMENENTEREAEGMEHQNKTKQEKPKRTARGKSHDSQEENKQ